MTVRKLVVLYILNKFFECINYTQVYTNAFFFCKLSFQPRLLAREGPYLKTQNPAANLLL
jgi:hypothetical protein